MSDSPGAAASSPRAAVKPAHDPAVRSASRLTRPSKTDKHGQSTRISPSVPINTLVNLVMLL